MFPAREVQGDQRRRPALGDDHSGLRGLRGASQRLPLALPRNGRREDRGSLPRNSHTFPYQGSKCGITFPELCRIGCHCWRWFLLGFRPLVTLVRMSAVVVVDSPWLSLVPNFVFIFFIWDFEGINFFLFFFNLCCFASLYVDEKLEMRTWE